MKTYCRGKNEEGEKKNRKRNRSWDIQSNIDWHIYYPMRNLEMYTQHTIRRHLNLSGKTESQLLMHWPNRHLHGFQLENLPLNETDITISLCIITQVYMYIFLSQNRDHLQKHMQKNI